MIERREREEDALKSARRHERFIRAARKLRVAVCAFMFIALIRLLIRPTVSMSAYAVFLVPGLLLVLILGLVTNEPLKAGCCCGIQLLMFVLVILNFYDQLERGNPCECHEKDFFLYDLSFKEACLHVVYNDADMTCNSAAEEHGSTPEECGWDGPRDTCPYFY